MKILLRTFLVSLITQFCFGQGTLKVHPNNNLDDVIIAKSGEFKDFFIYPSDQNLDKKASGTPIKIQDSCDEKESNVGANVFYQFNCKESSISIYLKDKGGKKLKEKLVWYCKKGGKQIFFVDKKKYEECEKANSNGSNTGNGDLAKSYDDILKIPFPTFEYDSTSRKSWNKHNRILYIDANPKPGSNTSVQLKKASVDSIEVDDKKVKTSSAQSAKTSLDSNGNTPKKLAVVKEVKASAVHKKGNLTVYLSSLKISEISELSLTINGTDYSYDKDLSEILGKLSTPDSRDKEKDGEEIKKSSSDGEKENLKTQRAEHLNSVLNYYKGNVKALSKDDIKELNQYKSVLENTVYANNIDLNEEGRKVLSELLSWSPKYIGLTPIAPNIADSDEINVSVSVKYNNTPKETVPIGSYKVAGGVSFDLGGAFFFTGLKNSRVFTEEVGEGDESQLLAKRDDENQLSVGFGLNSEVSFRTGYLLRPTFNIGAFIPFEEEISPYITIGPGVGLYDKKLKVNLLAGIAVGKVNAIKAEFIEKDLSDMDNLTNESISEKVWDTSWFIGIGIRYKFKEDK